MTPSILHHSGLAARMVIWTVSVTTIVLVSLLFWNHKILIQQLEQNALERMALITEGVAARVDSELGKISSLVNGMAMVLEAEGLNISSEEMQSLQRRVLNEYPALIGLGFVPQPGILHEHPITATPYLVRTAGAELASVDWTRDQTMLDEDWFVLPKYLGQPVWTEPVLMPDGSKHLIYSEDIWVTSGAGQVFAGVLRAELDLNWLDALIAAQPFGKGGYGGILTHNGTFLVHPIDEVEFHETFFSLAEERTGLASRVLGQHILSGKSGVTEWINWLHGEPGWLGWHPIQTTNWTMTAVVSRATLEAQMLGHTQSLVLLGVVGLLVLGLAVTLIAKSVTRPIRALSDAVDDLSGGNLDAPLHESRGSDEVARLGNAFIRMRESLKRYIANLQTATAARERIESELRVAHEIQMDSIPKVSGEFLKQIPADLAARILPARAIGGDFYDFFMLDQRRIVVIIGDVSGKGVPAALFMAQARSFLRLEMKSEADPGKALTRLNETLADGNDSCMFVTLFCAVIALDSGAMTFSNAGHNLPLLLGTDGSRTWLKGPEGSIAAGVLEGQVYDSSCTDLKSGQALLLYTDGITEAMSLTEQPFGENRMLASLASVGSLSCEDTLDRLLTEVQKYTQGSEQSDDITLLMIRWQPSPAPQACLECTWERRFDPDRASLAATLKDLDDHLLTTELSDNIVHAIRFVVEEVCSNAVKYGYPDMQSKEGIRVQLFLGPTIRILIQDDGQAFDPLQKLTDPDITLSVDERPVGGLGLFMVKRLASELTYKRQHGKNLLTVELAKQAS